MRTQPGSTWARQTTPLRALATQTSVRTLEIGAQQVTDKNLAYVGQMTGLEELNISWAHELTEKKGISPIKGREKGTEKKGISPIKES